MTCQNCREEATVHLTESIEGKVREIHLCGPCARVIGLPSPQDPPPLPIDKVLLGLISTHVGELVGELAERACPFCGLRYMEFRTGGRLGCPHDYQTFHSALLPIVRESHGATRHVGKVPLRNPDASETRPTLRLRAELRSAIDREDYERAAQIRDTIRQKD